MAVTAATRHTTPVILSGARQRGAEESRKRVGTASGLRHSPCPWGGPLDSSAALGITCLAPHARESGYPSGAPPVRRLVPSLVLHRSRHHSCHSERSALARSRRIPQAGVHGERPAPFTMSMGRVAGFFAALRMTCLALHSRPCACAHPLPSYPRKRVSIQRPPRPPPRGFPCPAPLARPARRLVPSLALHRSPASPAASCPPLSCTVRAPTPVILSGAR